MDGMNLEALGLDLNHSLSNESDDTGSNPLTPVKIEEKDAAIITDDSKQAEEVGEKGIESEEVEEYKEEEASEAKDSKQKSEKEEEYKNSMKAFPTEDKEEDKEVEEDGKRIGGEVESKENEVDDAKLSENLENLEMKDGIDLNAEDKSIYGDAGAYKNVVGDDEVVDEKSTKDSEELSGGGRRGEEGTRVSTLNR